MSNIPTEQVIILSEEKFYEHVRVQYGEKVEKILRYHDTDDYVVLHRINERQLLDIFEKSNDENDLPELIDLKKEVCNILDGKFTLKIGTKNKIIALLKSSRDIVKKNRRQLTNQAKLDRLNNYLSSSLSIDSNLSDAQMDMEKCAATIENSIEKILANMKNNVHGDVSTHSNLQKMKTTFYRSDNSEDLDNSASATIKKSFSQKDKSINESNGNAHHTTSSQTTTNRNNSQRIPHVMATGGGTQSNISYSSSSKSKQYEVTNKESHSNNRSATATQKQVTHSNHSSQPKKRKINEDDRQIRYYSSNNSNKKRSEQEIVYDRLKNEGSLSTFLNTIDPNRHRSPNNYRYAPSVIRFAVCFFILAGIYVYEFVRSNLKFLLPSISTIKKFYAENPYSEAKFRFDECAKYLETYQCQYLFMSEDCSAIIPRIEYDAQFNSFNGFVTPILDGIPIENSFSFDSFDHFKHAVDITPRSNLVNVHMAQPIPTSNSHVPAATALSAYGTDNKINSIDVLKRWLYIYQQFYAKYVRVIGYATDGDPKYLRAMRLASNFFVKAQTLDIYKEQLLFTIDIPLKWTRWYFLQPSQLFVFLQDANDTLPKSVADTIHLFSSQHCENVFRDARSLSGIYSTRINFTIKQFLKRTDKINALTELKQYELNNQHDKISFPVHHKIRKHLLNTESNINETNINETNMNFHSNAIEETIFRAYEVAKEMAQNVRMDIDLIRSNLFDIEQSSQIAKNLLKSNILTEEETLVVDDDDSDQDEERGVRREDNAEDDADGEPGISRENDVEEDEEDYDECCDIEHADTEINDEEDEINVSDSVIGGHTASKYKSTSTFDNIQAVSYPGVYLKFALDLDF
ncbi:unnamed protein product [Adineta ricciae]|uniref:Uncharacterized protein n=1 Tax=Adineta ricciae TaxID=249248 RepID=A0A815TJ31_ADIRI|nr:unnamed protein product [Adineta ricciae]